MSASRRFALLMAVALAVAGCGQTVPGTALSNQRDAQRTVMQMIGTADKAIATEVTAYNPRNRKATSYWYLRFAEAQLGSEYDVALLGRDPEMYERRQSKASPDLRLETYHPPGGQLDLVKLGPKFAHLAPTPWVSYPTFFKSETTLSCVLPAVETLCKIAHARQVTEQTNTPGRRREARLLPDGSAEMITGVSVKSLVEAKVIALPPEQLWQMPPEMIASDLSMKIKLDRDRALLSVEIIGEVPGKPTPLRIQVGYEVKGRAAKTDFPQPPAPAEITAIPDEAGRAAFLRKIDEAAK